MSCAHISALSAGLWETAGALLVCGKKNTPENWETGSSGFICCVFPAGLLLLLRLTCLSSHRLCCSRILHACWPCTVCSFSWASGGPRPRAELCGAVCELLRAARGCLCLSEGPCKVPQAKAWAHKEMYTSSSSVVVQKEQPAVCPSVHSPPWTVLPLSLLFFSYLFLHSFFSRQYNNLSSLGCFSSSIPKPSWKIYQTIFLGQVLIWWLCLDAVQSHSFGEEWSEGLNCEAEIKRS